MNLFDRFAVLQPDLSVGTVPVSPDLYEELDRKFDAFRGHVLISAHSFSADWGVWERHPAGDELVVLLAGRARLVLRGPDGDETHDLETAGTYVVVPRGAWHTARVSEPARLLFITPGEGTEHREEPDDDPSPAPDASFQVD